MFQGFLVFLNSNNCHRKDKAIVETTYIDLCGMHDSETLIPDN